MRSRKRRNHVQSAGGFTLLELVIVLVVAAILVVWGFPSLLQSIHNNQVASQNLSLMAMLNLTKSEAVRRNASVTMVITPRSNGWDAVVEDPADEAEVEGCVPGQLRCAGNSLALVSYVGPDEDDCGAGDVCITFNNRGYVDPGSPPTWEARTLFLQHQDCAGDNQRSRIDILPTGQISSCSLSCDSTADCP